MRGEVKVILVACCFAVLPFCTVDRVRGVEALCPPQWTFWGQNCYRLFNNHRLDWQSAEQFCNQFGNVHDGGEDQIAHLVSIHSEVENTFVRALWEGLREPGSVRKYCWIGYNDIATEGSFVWSDQCPSQYSKWGIGQPNSNGGNQDCGSIDTSGTGKYFGWDDSTCTAILPFMCKMLPVFVDH